ncbi:outer membrane exchange protein TraA family protein [Sorangium sp. So ce388]|uniref:outer membrane exchange protein TraA family protein n=1 Tax=Sorangium sp. So ce388 TaxID=3133309 RepID=UPI003F5B6D6D
MSYRPLPLTTSLAIAFSLALGASGSAIAAPVIIDGDPVAPLPAEGGTGLCAVHGLSTDPAGDFYDPTGEDASFIEKMNTFFDAGERDLVSFVASTPLDFSNNNNAGNEWSFGDFRDAVSGCPTGGCDFRENDPSVSFGVRLRGYLAVLPEHVDAPLHFGIYADDAVALVIYDAAQAVYPVLVQSPVLGRPTWRMTNTVTFSREGLYPVELLYAGIAEHSALEVSVLAGEFADFQLGAAEPGSVSLAESGFTLLPPASFHQTLLGGASASEGDACAQCGREYVDMAGNNGCDPGSYCNSAALCAPCDLDAFCGPSCSPCGGATPRCAVVEGTPACVACAGDADCDDGEVCDPEAHACVADSPEPGAGGGGGDGAGGGGAASGPGSDDDDGGCGCRVGGRGRVGGLAITLAGLGIALARRRLRALRRPSASMERAPR